VAGVLLAEPHLFERAGDEDLIRDLVQPVERTDGFHATLDLVRERPEADAKLAEQRLLDSLLQPFLLELICPGVRVLSQVVGAAGKTGRSGGRGSGSAGSARRAHGHVAKALTSWTGANALPSGLKYRRVRPFRVSVTVRVTSTSPALRAGEARPSALLAAPGSRPGARNGASDRIAQYGHGGPAGAAAEHHSAEPASPSTSRAGSKPPRT